MNIISWWTDMYKCAFCMILLNNGNVPGCSLTYSRFTFSAWSMFSGIHSSYLINQDSFIMSDPPAMNSKVFNGVTISQSFSSSGILNASALYYGWVSRSPDGASIKVNCLIECYWFCHWKTGLQKCRFLKIGLRCLPEAIIQWREVSKLINSWK